MLFAPTLISRYRRITMLLPGSAARATIDTDLVFEAFQFFVKQTPWGTMQMHGYPYAENGSTFIVEMHEDVWRAAGLDATEDEQFPPGVSDKYAAERMTEIWAEELGGHQILTNNSKWINFTTVRNERW